MARGIVAASHPLAAAAGAEILRAGGNAVDAAAAVQFALNVAEPAASGIGGGGFSLIHLARGETLVLDSRECAPAAATADQFLKPDGRPIPLPGRERQGNAVGVPGALFGQAEALRRWGSLPLRRVLQPAIDLAEGGVQVSAFLARRLEQAVELLGASPAAAAVFLPGGHPLAEGERLVQPDLARALRLIAESGPDVLYGGDIGRAVVAEVRARGGRMTMRDLMAYRAQVRRPLSGAYRGWQVLTMPPPGSGVTLLQMLGLLEGFDLAASGRLSTTRAHLELQAMRLAQADRAAFLGDPAFVDVPVGAFLDGGYLATRRKLIRLDRPGGRPKPGRPFAEHGVADADLHRTGAHENGQTTHFVVTDRWGNLVCCTTTIESWFGTGLMTPGYGFFLNNELTDFDPEPGGPNEARPFARPASSMTPTLVMREGRPWLALGSPGGPTIVTAVLQVIVAVLDDDLPLQAAVDSPRFFAGRYPRVTWEEELPPATLAGLRELGYEPAAHPTTIGAVQAVMLDTRTRAWTGAADARREGTVVDVE